MTTTNKTAMLAAVTVALACATASAGETVTYKGSGTYVSQQLTMTLGNGNTVFGARNEGVATISTDPPTLLFGKCMGLGLITGDNDYSADVYCTFRANQQDSFDVRAKTGSKGGTARVIGGSGKWAGATGTAKMDRTSQAEYGGTYTFEIEITTP